MKLTNVKEYDYTRLDSRWSSCLRTELYWGVHVKDGRCYVDADRFKWACEEWGYSDLIPEEWRHQENIGWFLPDQAKRYDYKFNRFQDLLNSYKKQWFEEYKPIFKLITTPEQVGEQTRVNAMMFGSSADDYEWAQEKGFMAMVARMAKYDRVIHSLYCTFIMQLATELDRYILIIMSELGYKGEDFGTTSFYKFSDGLQKDKTGKKVNELNKYNAYNLLHQINNFLKHNTLASYKKLKRNYPKNVRSKENITSFVDYENGMYAGNWIILEKDYIDNLFPKLIAFFKDYCVHFLKENVDEASWNYDDYFLEPLRRLEEEDECDIV